jgi:hypothetical protein
MFCWQEVVKEEVALRCVWLVLGTAALVLTPGPAPAFDMGVQDLHQYDGDSESIFIGRFVSLSKEDSVAGFEVAQWVKPPAGAPEANRPTRMQFMCYPILTQAFLESKPVKRQRFLVFVSPGIRAGNSQLFAAIEIDENGALRNADFLTCLDPQPKTIDDLLAQIRRLQSKDYHSQLIARLNDAKLEDHVRADEARRLGLLRAADAWNALEHQAVMPRPGPSAIPREALNSLARIDPARTMPICLRLVRDSRSHWQVESAARHLTGRASDDPQALETLLAAAAYWERERPYPAVSPLAELVGAVSAQGKVTPEVEAFLVHHIKEGRDSVLAYSMRAAGRLKFRRAVPLICDRLGDEKTRSSAAVSLMSLLGDELRRYSVNRRVAEAEARQAAIAAFPDWSEPLVTAKTIALGSPMRVVMAAAHGQEIYILVGWQQPPEREEPYLRACLLYRTDEPTTRPAPRTN